MKSILIFLLSLIIGVSAITGYAYWNHQQKNVTISNSLISTKFSLANAPADSLKGTIASMSGTVNWLSRVAKTPVKLTSKQLIQQGEELGTEKNGNVAVVINKSSVVTLAPNSHVNFIQLLPINIVVAQDKGTTQYEADGTSPISVNTLDLITTFSRSIVQIFTDPVSKTITIAVEKGTATEGYEDLQNNSNVVTVTAGKEFVFDDTSRTGTIE